MDDFLAYRRIDGERYLYISTLSKSAVSESAAYHLGDDGYFLYECGPRGIDVLAKVASFESAHRLLEIYGEAFERAVKFGERRRARTDRRFFGPRQKRDLQAA
jgi:hypothetical protein